MKIGNLFSNADPPADGERFEILLKHRNLAVERIISSDTVTPVEYIQEQDEWVVLLRGEAVLKASGESYTLVAGDHAFLPAGTPHTVERVSQGALWLAVHLQPDQAAPVE